MQRRFDEYLAKVVLESCFPERFSDLQISDKPDLRQGNEIGIEVTSCTLQRVREVEGLLRSFGKGSQERKVQRLSQLGELYKGSNGEISIMVGFPGIYSNDIDKSPSKGFLDAVAEKVKCLNSDTANYANIPRYELFVYSSTVMIPEFQEREILKRLQRLNNIAKHYSYMYFLTNEQTLMGIDMKTESIIYINLYEIMDSLVNKAIFLFRSEK